MIYRRLLLLALVCALAGCSSASPGRFIGAGSSISATLAGGATSLALDGTTTTGTITVSESGYTGVFTASSSDAAVATVSPSSAPALITRAAAVRDTASSGTVFTVTAVSAGTATITISDSFGDKTAIPVSVTTVSGVITVSH